MSWGDLVMCRFPLNILNVRRFICKTKRYISSLPNPLAGATTAHSGGKQKPIAQIECCKLPNYTQSAKTRICPKHTESLVVKFVVAPARSVALVLISKFPVAAACVCALCELRNYGGSKAANVMMPRCASCAMCNVSAF